MTDEHRYNPLASVALNLDGEREVRATSFSLAAGSFAYRRGGALAYSDDLGDHGVARDGNTRLSWLTDRMKKLADYGRDDHRDDDDQRAQLAWAVAAIDDCDGCDDVRVELTIEQVNKPGTGLVAHLAPKSARALRAALALALREMGEPAD